MLDATRMVENALFIQEREEGYADRTIAEILLEFCSYTDGAWMSAKKDNLVNIGGWLAVNDDAVFEELRNLVVVYEGLHTYGGLAGRDMEALAIGIEESVSDEHVRSRVGQVRYLGELLQEWDIPIVEPVGGHAIFLDARRFYPHLAAGPVPGPDAGRGAVPRLRHPVDGAGDRVRRPQRGDGRPQPAEAGADPAHDPAARVHAGAHGRGGRVREGLLRRPGPGPRPADGLRAEVPAVLPGAVRAALIPPGAVGRALALVASAAWPARRSRRSSAISSRIAARPARSSRAWRPCSRPAWTPRSWRPWPRPRRRPSARGRRSRG